MFSRSIAAAVLKTTRRPIRVYPSRSLDPRPAVKLSWRNYADTVVKVPQMAESISEGTLKQLSKGVGDRVIQDEEIATIETDKIDVAVNAPGAGVIKEVFAKEEDNVVVGQDLVRIELGNASTSDEKKLHTKADVADENTKCSAAKSQPPTKETVSEPGHNREMSFGHGEQSHAGPQQQATQKSNNANFDLTAPQKLIPVPSNREERRIKMNRMRLRIAERLKQSQNTAASLTTFNEVDMSQLIEFRRLYLDEILKKTGVKLGFMSAFSRAAVLAMRDIPAVNASIEGPNGGDTIIYRDYVDVSVAVATEKGLVTPVVRNVESLDMIGVERAIAEMGKKARDGKLSIEDMAGGTFTISNGGIFGSLMERLYSS
ncbi:hypothetical protein XA68_11040 [Ophiocordyceps unilateralis]|uniref:Dihydrolipoamide acetyltransferase component of pyruvate dehydrogenase complex n=1 Tax=Ophiocordyceps unilateralis TaxID=268505 RepID=A0A2A9P237_OPHUN|nr:hypothetical protein XA68_11040 [Ophiocordyceps unilateralis]